MVSYRNLGRDINASPLQFRVWITDGYPDLSAELYSGYKAGNDSLVDISSSIVVNDTDVVDFNQIKPMEWSAAKETLPEVIESSSLAVIDGYVYLFGGRGTNKIFKASVGNPGKWEDTGATLPDSQLYGSHCAVLDDGYVYLFGGNNGAATSSIYSAPILDPLNWTKHVELLPEPRYWGTLQINDGTIFLFGGKGVSTAENTIFTASVTDPLTWTNISDTIPEPLYASQGTTVGGQFYLFGGNNIDNNPIETIYNSPTGSINFTSQSSLPYKTSHGQLCFLTDYMYFYTPCASVPDGYGGEYTTQTRILRAARNNPLLWQDTGTILPAELSMSQIGIIYDRFFSFGGSGSSAIFATELNYTFLFDNPDIVSYGLVTRTLFNSAVGISNKFGVLGMPPWKTSYGE